MSTTRNDFFDVFGNIGRSSDLFPEEPKAELNQPITSTEIGDPLLNAALDASVMTLEVSKPQNSSTSSTASVLLQMMASNTHADTSLRKQEEWRVWSFQPIPVENPNSRQQKSASVLTKYYFWDSETQKTINKSFQRQQGYRKNFAKLMPRWTSILSRI